MAVRLFVVGSTRESYLLESEQEYLKRLQRYVKLDYRVLPSSKNETLADKCLQQEEVQILQNIKEDDFVILLDEAGDEYTSRKFATELNHWLTSRPNLVFVIGGAFGFSDTIYARANGKLSLSKLTFPHHLVRTIFLEQLYRAYTILKGGKYHND